MNGKKESGFLAICEDLTVLSESGDLLWIGVIQITCFEKKKLMLENITVHSCYRWWFAFWFAAGISSVSNLTALWVTTWKANK